MKTKLFFIGMLAIVGLSANAQTWIGMTPYGGSGTSGAVGFIIGSKIYVGTGGSQSSGQFWEYDTTTGYGGTWVQIANFGGGYREGAVAFSIGGYGYVGTGSSGSNHQDFWRYDTTGVGLGGLGTWTQMSNFPGGLRDNAVGFSICDKGYVGTGTDGTNNYNDFYEYNPTLGVGGSWTLKAPLPGGVRTGAVGFSIGNKGYIGTGNSVYTPRADFWEYDPTANSWTRRDSFPGAGRNAAVGFSIGNKGYIGTGSSAGYYTNCLNDFYEWNQATNTWAAMTNYSTTCNGAVGISNGSNGSRGYIVTGNGCNFGLQNFYQYHPSHLPVVAFLPNGSPICIDSCISFRDTSTTAPTTWIWSFQGGSPDTSTAQNPGNICFNSTGIDTITLTAANCNFSNSAKFILSVQSCVTGISEVSNDSKIDIYPNPFSSEATIITGKKLTDGTLNIYDMFGRRVKQIQNISGQEITIDRNGLSNGIYFIRLLQDRKVIWSGKAVITD